ncbi:MAG: MBL fold metallo-hydrolase [Salaquimonas sp.]
MPYLFSLNPPGPASKLALWSMTALLFCLLSLFATIDAFSQSRQPSTCLAIAQNQTPLPIINTSAAHQGFTPVQSDQYSVNIRYVTHSTYRIESPEGVVIATDFSGNAGAGKRPDIVTMNHAHGTHFTHFPDTNIPHVLKGWGEEGGKASHYLELNDTLTRNVSSDIYRGGVLIEADGNSIFIFEIAGLCIGHVGHLHHTLTPEHFAAIGRLDVLMIPVDGGRTMSIEGMSNLARQFRSSMILPMHWFSGYSLQRFIQNVSASFAIDMRNDSSLDVSLNSLPGRPTVVVLQPEISERFDFGD